MRTSQHIFGVIIIAALSLAVCTLKYHQLKKTADTIYYGGRIITMDPKYKDPSYVAVKDGKILEVGYRHNYKRLIGKKTQLVKLSDRALIPGIVDAHSHFSLTTTYVHMPFVISQPPFGTAASISQILINIKNYLEKAKTPPGTELYGFGYNDQELLEHRHPTRYELDSVSTVHPIVLRHYTGHLVAVNSYALNAVGFTDSTQPPPGGYFDRYDNGSLTGVLR